MAFQISNPGNPKAPSTAPTPQLPDLKDQKKQINELKKNQGEINKIKTEINKSVEDINKALGGKAAKQIVLLRLDMVADKLEHYNSRLASQIDIIANAVEASWEI